AAKRLGAQILTDTEVTSIAVNSGKVEGVQTNIGKIAAEVVINAAGVYAPFIGRMVGVEIPIVPRRGQILVTEPLPPLINSIMLCACYIVAKFKMGSGNVEKQKDKRRVLQLSGDDWNDGRMEELHSAKELDANCKRRNERVEKQEGKDPNFIRDAQLGVGTVLEQHHASNLLIGSTREFVGYDRRVTIEGMRAVARHAKNILPILRDVHIIRSFAGLRPYTSDGLPFIGYIGGPEGFLVAVGHEGDGIALAPITGKLMADCVENAKRET
ncbi:MAG: NAD(P)/FAD-dependent oxidoreductase, partial [Candidatus Poribacteria bacterium]